MEDFITELRLALADYFCGTFTQGNGTIIAKLNDGRTVSIRVEEKS